MRGQRSSGCRAHTWWHYSNIERITTPFLSELHDCNEEQQLVRRCRGGSSAGRVLWAVETRALKAKLALVSATAVCKRWLALKVASLRQTQLEARGSAVRGRAPGGAYAGS